jgi:hypothetical protein
LLRVRERSSNLLAVLGSRSCEVIADNTDTGGMGLKAQCGTKVRFVQ